MQHSRSSPLAARSALVFVFLLLTANTAVAVTVPVESGFDADLEGWTCDPSSACSWSASGGNPGGYVHYSVEPFTTAIIAPTAYLGDWSDLDEQGSLLLDFRVISLGLFVQEGLGNYTAQISGPGGTASASLETPVDELGWVTVEVPVQESAWDVSAGSWPALLGDVQDLRVSALNIINVEVQADGIDNVRLVPEPGTALLLSVGLLALARQRVDARRRD